MIVKDEEDTLDKVLKSAELFVDEIIIVDTGSTDTTKEIAYKYTDKVYDFKWTNNFAAARNFAYSKATMDYQMWLDADDFVPKGEGEKILELKRTLPPDIDMVTMKYHTHFDENKNPTLTSTRERLTKTVKNYKWIEPVHECIPLGGNIYHSDIAIWHEKPKRDEISTRNLDIYTMMENDNIELSPRAQYYFARELKDHKNYKRAIYYFDKFLKSNKGWLEDNIAACHSLALCYKALLNEDRQENAKYHDKILSILLESFKYATPRAEICCEIGYYFKDIGYYSLAIDWFLLATKIECEGSIGFVLADYKGYVPNIESSVCYSYLGDYEKAKEFNEKAAKFKPDSYAVKHNRKFFSEMESN